MKTELDKQLCEEFPLLYADRNATMYETCMCWGFPGDGWFDIIYELSSQLEPLIQKWIDENPENCIRCKKHKNEHDGDCEFKLLHPRAAQVKEKFGGLRFYMDYATKEMNKLVSKTESKSYVTCEYCGKEGKETGSGWIKTLCQECNEANE